MNFAREETFAPAIFRITEHRQGACHGRLDSARTENIARILNITRHEFTDTHHEVRERFLFRHCVNLAVAANHNSCRWAPAEYNRSCGCMSSFLSPRWLSIASRSSLHPLGQLWWCCCCCSI